MFPAAGIRALWRQEERQHTDPQEHLIALGSHLKTWEHFRGPKIAEEACLSVTKGQILAVLQLSLSSRHLSLSPHGCVGKGLAAMVVLSQAAGRAVSQNCCLAKDSVVFSKLSFADQSPCVPPLPVVSPSSVSIPGDSAGARQAAPPLWLNQH